MKCKRVVPRELARQDVEDAVGCHLSEDAASVAIGFPRDPSEPDLPDPRSWPMTRHPYLVFHVEHPDQVDAWRVSHALRDMPASMREPDSSHVQATDP